MLVYQRVRCPKSKVVTLFWFCLTKGRAEDYHLRNGTNGNTFSGDTDIPLSKTFFLVMMVLIDFLNFYILHLYILECHYLEV